MSGKLINKVNAVAYHRNGISGAPFNVVLFTMKDDETKKMRNMIGILFGDGEETMPVCAVLDVDMVAAGNVRFAENSWRGDSYAPELAEAVRVVKAD
ncbi:unnamed protein product [marine sediment metagenome]|uniref:Uncharacterized protein n=1 Tax=marine sediment metagenome TaxID=412755 RepID=X0W8C5_9ZZZZ